MNNQDIYRKLQEHLDTLPIGYPPTGSGVEIRLLKHLFDPDEAKVASQLCFDPRPLTRIHQRLRGTRISYRELEQILDSMYYKGTVDRTIQHGEKHYSNLMFILGIWESRVERLTKEFVEDLQQYFQEAFDEDLNRSKTPTFRTVPVEKSIPIEFNVASYDQVRILVEEAGNQIAVANCVCRQAMDVIGQNCSATDLRETCLVFKETAEHHCELGIARPITREDALRILEKAQQAGLVLQPENAKRPQFVCCCCGCCCEVLTRAKRFPHPVELYATNHYCEVVPGLCKACETCVDVCQLDARSIVDGVATVNLERCIGCGNCVTSCQYQACRLRKREKESVPPEDSKALYVRIAGNKSSKK